MKTIGIIYGGDSSEIIVSKKSAEGIQAFIDPNKYKTYPILITKNKWATIIDGTEHPIDKNDFSFIHSGEKIIIDCAYITIHGTPGEDGKLQGYFDLVGIPHTTCSTLTAALTFNKFTCNTYLKGFGVAVADSVLLRKDNSYDPATIIEKLQLPCFVKPNAGGSSFGITKVKETEDLEGAIQKAFAESNEVIIEECLSGKELTCGVFKTGKGDTILPITEIISPNEFFDFDAKYTPEKAQEITPARIPQNTTERVQKIASLIYDILGCKGIIRVDFILSEEKIFLLEVNTTPGMTTTSFIPQQITAANLDIQEVFSEIIENAISA